MKDLENISDKDYQELQDFYKYTEKLYDFTNDILFKNKAETILQTLKYYNRGGSVKKKSKGRKIA